jgi:hypothetical protein
MSNSWWSWFSQKTSSPFTTPPTPTTSQASPLTPFHLDQSPQAAQIRLDFKAITKQTMEQEQKSGPKKIFWATAQVQPVLEHLLKKHHYSFQFQPAICASCACVVPKCRNRILHAAWYTSSGYQIRW